MTLKLRTREGIQRHLLGEVSRKTVSAALPSFHKLEGTSKELRQHKRRINTVLLNAAYGKRVFRGSLGRGLKAVAEARLKYKTNPQHLREIAGHLLRATEALYATTIAIPDNEIPGDTKKARGKFIQTLHAQTVEMRTHAWGILEKGKWNWWEK